MYLDNHKRIVKRFTYDYKLLELPDCHIEVIKYFARLYFDYVMGKDFWIHPLNPIPDMIANNPNTPADILAKLVIKERLMPLVLNNAIFDLLLLENPNLLEQWLNSQSLIYLAQLHRKNLPINYEPVEIIHHDEIRDFATTEGFIDKDWIYNNSSTYNDYLIIRYVDDKSKILITFRFNSNNSYWYYRNSNKFNFITVELSELQFNPHNKKTRYKITWSQTLPMCVDWRSKLRLLIKNLSETSYHQYELPSILEYQEEAY